MKTSKIHTIVKRLDINTRTAEILCFDKRGTKIFSYIHGKDRMSEFYQAARVTKLITRKNSSFVDHTPKDSKLIKTYRRRASNGSLPTPVVKVLRTGDYAASTELIAGSVDDVAEDLLQRALESRITSRRLRSLDTSDSELPRAAHPSQLVTMSVEAIRKLYIKELVGIMSQHGVFKYTIHP